MAMATASRSSGANTQAPAKRLSLADRKNTGSGQPGRWCIYGPEGSGKTTLGTMFPKPIFLQSAGETGLETLLDSGRVKNTDYLPACGSWGDALGIIDELCTTEHDFKTLVIDTANGLELLCYDEVCRRDFNGDRGKGGFESYMQGYRVSQNDWRMLLSSLDKLRETRRMTIVLLAHSAIKDFKNPTGADYDRYAPSMHRDIWGLTLKWVDAALFIDFETFVKTEKSTDKKGKGAGGTHRIMRCERTAAWDAKNRHGLPSEIDLGETPEEMWEAFSSAIKAGRQKGGE